MSAISINSVEFNFENHNVRIVIIENNPWFVAVDICNVLGIQNPTKALKSLDEDERSNFKLGRQGDANIISESGMYTLVLRCRDAIKKGTIPHRFRKWVTAEVLPSIRKTGSYEALRRATGTPSPLQFSVEDIPVLEEEFTRILTVTSKACELIGSFEKEVLKQVIRNRKDYELIASQFNEEFKLLQFLPKSIEALESFEKFGLARLANRTH